MQRSLALDAPFRVDGTGRIAAVSDFTGQIQARIIGLLGAAKGERVMRPSYGVGLLNEVFDVNDQLQSTRIGGIITDMVRTYEPAIVIDNVGLQSQDPAGGQMVLLLDYHLVTTGDTYSVAIKVGATATYGWPEVMSG
jgi:uncharacterized protein